MTFLINIINTLDSLFTLFTLELFYLLSNEIVLDNEILLSIIFSMKLLKRNDSENDSENPNDEEIDPLKIELDDYNDFSSNYNDFTKIEKILREVFGINILEHPNRIYLIINILIDLNAIKSVAFSKGYSTEEYRKILRDDPLEKIFFKGIQNEYARTFRQGHIDHLKDQFRKNGMED